VDELYVVQEMNITLTPEEIETHLHNSSPNPREYRMRSLTCFIDSERQIIKQIDVCLTPQVGGATRIIRFIDVWINSHPGNLAMPEPLGSGILIVDIKDRGWQHQLLVVGDDDDQPILFGARIMQEAQQVGDGDAEEAV